MHQSNWLWFTPYARLSSFYATGWVGCWSRRFGLCIIACYRNPTDINQEAIASIGDLNHWQIKLDHISRIIFLGTPHIGNREDTYAPHLLRRLHLDRDGTGNRSFSSPSSPALSQLYQAASGFVNTFHQIDSKARILSGYETFGPKKRILGFKMNQGRSKPMVWHILSRSQFGTTSILTLLAASRQKHSSYWR
jgi:hypothetical protein